MIFSTSHDGFEWSLEFGADSITVTVKVLIQETRISSQELPLVAWSLLLSQIQDFLNNHRAPFAPTANQEGIMELRDEVLSSVSTQDMDTSWYRTSDLDNFEFHCENSQLDVDAVFRPGLDTHFSPTAFGDLEM